MRPKQEIEHDNLRRAELELKQTERLLRESEKRFRGTLDTIMEGFQIIGFDWRYLYVNEAAARHGRRTQEDLPGQKITEAYPGIENTEVFRHMRRCMEERVPAHIENLFEYPDGAKAWFEPSTQPVPEGIFLLFLDNTQRKQTEQALQRSESRYRNLFAYSPSAVIVNMGDKVLLVNQACVRLFGAEKAEDLVGRTVYNLVHPDYHQHVREGSARLLESANSAPPLENKIIRLDGATVDAGVVAAPFRYGDKEAIHVIIHDLTERKKAEKDRETLRTQLAQAQKMESIGRLAGGVAHDFNNLLAIILGYGELLSADLEPGSKVHRFAESMIEAGRRARDLVGQLLAFSRKQTLSFRPVNLNRTMDNFKNLLKRTIPENIRITTFLENELLPAMADEGQLDQVIMNLAANSAEAMPGGGIITIETDLVYLDQEYAAKHVNVEPGQYVMLAISDTGTGMDPETAKLIFDPFFSTKGDQGTGLGLATVYGIVRQHNGNIWVYSEPGKGTTFKIYLPAAEEGLYVESGRTKVRLDPRGDETILLVEDNDDLREMLHGILTGKGYSVIGAASGYETPTFLEENDKPLHLLLTDVIMPGLNGRELYEQCIARYPELKVLYMSGYTDNIIAHHGVLDQRGNFLQKPFSNMAVTQKLREVLDQNAPPS